MWLALPRYGICYLLKYVWEGYSKKWNCVQFILRFNPTPSPFPSPCSQPFLSKKRKNMMELKLVKIRATAMQLHIDCLPIQGTIQLELRGVKIGIKRSIMMYSLAGKCPLPCPKGHHYERSINVFRGFSTFWRHPIGSQKQTLPLVSWSKTISASTILIF